MRRSVAAILLVCGAILAVYLGALRYEAAHYGPLRPRWLSDDFDRNGYWHAAQFLPSQKVAFLEVSSPYPTLATLLFTTPLLASPGFQLDKGTYRFAWSCLMAGFLIATVWLIGTFRIRNGLAATPALLMLAPSPLYFSLMRFDIVCAFLVCLSLAAFSRERYAAAHFILATATLVKWYPALVFPVYLAFHWAREPLPVRLADLWRTRTARYAAVFVGTVAVIVGASIVAFTWDGFLAPYRFHAGRGGQYFNPYWMLERKRLALGFDQLGLKIAQAVFIVLEFSIVGIVLVKRIASTTDVFRYAILAIVLFITFSRIDSPQWILWYVPAALMFVRDTRTLAAIAVLGVVNYLVFPVGFDTLGARTTSFSALVLAKGLTLLALMYFMFRERGPDHWTMGEARVAPFVGTLCPDRRT